jgi:hypothetical protein
MATAETLGWHVGLGEMQGISQVLLIKKNVIVLATKYLCRNWGINCYSFQPRHLCNCSFATHYVYFGNHHHHHPASRFTLVSVKKINISFM